MDQPFDIAIRRARLRGRGDRLAEIGIKQGRIVAIGENLERRGTLEIDARGNLVTKLFVNPHLHLCKVWTLPMMEEEALKSYQGEAMGKAMAGIELAAKIKEKYAEIVDRRKCPSCRGAGGAPWQSAHSGFCRR